MLTRSSISRCLHVACLALLLAAPVVLAHPTSATDTGVEARAGLALGERAIHASADSAFEWHNPTSYQQRDESLQLPLTGQSEKLGRRSDIPPVPLSQLGPPNFPPEYASCRQCQYDYPGISSCMEASAVFANATSIFNDPISYIAVIKCACTDTFQSAFPQCVDCFQHTNQCWYLGTDPQGTGAPQLITNIRQICGFGSALLGGVAGANGLNYSHNVSIVPTYTDVTTIGQGYHDQSSGPIFPSAARVSISAEASFAIVAAASTLLSGIFVLL